MNCKPVRAALVSLIVVSVFVVVAGGAQVAEIARDSSDNIVLYGQAELHRTVEPVSELRSGGDPSGVGLFVIWNEAAERWGAFSRDAGASWSRARPIRVGLQLRDVNVQPGLASTMDARLHLVQFRTVSLPEWREALKELGVEVLQYFPHNAHIIRADPSRLEQIRGLDFVESVQPYHPSYRIESSLRQELVERTGSDETRIRVLVFEWGPVAKERVLAAATGLGARVAEYWTSGHVLELWADRAATLALAAHDDVMWIDRWTPPGIDMDLVREDAGAHARLDWLPAAAGGAYRVYRSDQSDVNFQLHAEIDLTLFDDVDVMADGQTWYYLVNVIDACGNEGPR